jgi:hypothetical protein
METAAKALRIVIPGGTGQIGQILTRHLSGRGNDVTVLTRNPSGAERDWVPWRTLAWDAEKLGEWTSALEGAEVLISLAGRSVNCRYNAKNRSEILESRVRSTQVLGEAIKRLEQPLPSFDRAMDEISGEIGGREADAPAKWRFSIDVATRWEGSFFGAVTPRTRKVALRGGMVMNPDPSGIFGHFLRLLFIAPSRNCC